MVTNADTIIDPGAMVVHFNDAALACATMVSSTRFKCFAFSTIFFIFMFYQWNKWVIELSDMEVTKAPILLGLFLILSFIILISTDVTLPILSNLSLVSPWLSLTSLSLFALSMSFSSSSLLNGTAYGGTAPRIGSS